MNTRKTIIATLFAAAFVAPLAIAPVHAQTQAQATRNYTQAELDQMLAPIALYPDPLLSQVLMAATYPIEVVEAARWTRANPNLQGDAAVRAVENHDWDPSVKSLVAFPQILQRMDEQLNWTESLGDAFLAQESSVMDSVQHLRQRAQAAGNLQSSEQIRVEQQGPTILIEPASPQYVYVPYYDPQVVYGTWWWPAYRPVYWAPWPGYARAYRPGYSAGFWWGQPVGLSFNFFFGNVDWRYRRVHVAHPTAYYYRPPVYANRSFAGDRGRWQHDPHHRRGVDYRAAEVRQRFAGAPAERRDAQRDARRDERGLDRRDSRQGAQPAGRPLLPATQDAQQREARERGGQDRAERREAQRPEQREAPRPEQTRPERRDGRDARDPRDGRDGRDTRDGRDGRDDQQRQRRDAQSSERSQQLQREQAQAAERAQRDQQRQQSEAARAQQQQQQRQQAEAARAQQQLQQRQQAEAGRAQQRQQAEAARAQQQQQRQEQRAMPAAQAPQQPRAERQERREDRRDGRQEQRQERGQKG